MYAPPANDNFASPQAISGVSGSSTPVLTQAATKEAGEPNHGGDPGGKSVWYRWTAPSSGNATVNTNGSTFTTGWALLGVYTGSAVNSLTTIASNNPFGPPAQLTFAATSGTTYQIAVDGYGARQGR